jgi:hypothetical protein
MGIGLTNKDMSFFSVESDDIDLEKQVMSQDIQNLTITEELGKMDTGSITFNDPNHFYSRVLRTGVTLRIAWGYAMFGSDLSIPENLFNADEFSQNLERRGLRVLVVGPQGRADEQGRVTYNCNFQALDMRGSNNFVRYTSGNKGDVIGQIMDRLGIDPAHRDINFQRMQEKITPSTEVMQWESDFKTLARLSIEWRTVFRMGYAQDGAPVGIFVDPWAIGDSPATATLSGAATSVYYDYRGGYINQPGAAAIANVQSYSWKDQSGESGVGDNIQMRWVGGKPVFYHYVAETQSVTVWELNEGAMQAELDRHENFLDKAAVIKEWVGARTFEQIKDYFTPIKQETAPQGSGIITNIVTIGNPMFTAGLRAELGPGFPERVRQKGVAVYIRKVAHKIDANYMCDHELVDAFVLSPTGQVIISTGGR